MRLDSIFRPTKHHEEFYWFPVCRARGVVQNRGQLHNCQHAKRHQTHSRKLNRAVSKRNTSLWRLHILSDRNPLPRTDVCSNIGSVRCIIQLIDVDCGVDTCYDRQSLSVFAVWFSVYTAVYPDS